MITFIPLTGFLGAGKTTTMIASAKALQQQGRNVAVITNDQGTELVDTKLVRSSLDSVAEITGGCFCCRFDDLAEAIAALAASDGVDTVIAEAVGSCTDLQATVVRPLRQYCGEAMVVAPLTTVLDPLRYFAFERAEQRGIESDLAYLFRQQLQEADVIALNKLDTIAADRADALLTRLRDEHPKATVVGYSATDRDNLDALLNAWVMPPSNSEVTVDIDYDRYAAAESQLAWLNQELHLSAAGDGFDAAAWAGLVLESLSAWAVEEGALIGHAKVAVERPTGDLAKASLTAAGAHPTLDRAEGGTWTRGRALLNARVACDPATLDGVVAQAVVDADLTLGVTSSATAAVSFKPSYPRPVHRLAGVAT